VNRIAVGFAGLAAAALSSTAAFAITLDQAIASALAHAPAVKAAEADNEAAAARLDQARAERRPMAVASAEAGTGTSDLGGFFGIGRESVSPRAARLSLQQPLFTGGAVRAGVAAARAGGEAAEASLADARLNLRAEVAAVFMQVMTAEQSVTLQQSQVEALAALAEQARLKFEAGDVPRTDLAQAEMRWADARAGLAQAQGDLAVARARYRSLTGDEAIGLEPPDRLPPAPPSLEDALLKARLDAKRIEAAEAALRAAEEGVRRARAAGSPTVALVAEASSVRDQFFPGYQADGAMIGVQARWPLYSGGRTAGKAAEAVAARDKARAQLEGARQAVDQLVIEAWQARLTAEARARAGSDQVVAAETALFSVENEVRVGQKPTLDLLDARRDLLAARIARLRAEEARVAAAFRLAALTATLD
jgi:outer membrane protein